MDKDNIVVGQITKPHGVRGEVKVFPLTDDSNRFKQLKKVLIDGEERVITSCKLQSKRIILKIEGIDSMNEAENYRNKYLEIYREDAVELPEDEYYVADLIGCTVFDENGEELGTVYDVIHTGSNDVYWVKNGEKEVLIPVLKEIVLHINIEDKKIIIKPVKEWSE